MSEILINPNRPSRTDEGDLTLTGVARELFRDMNSIMPSLDVLKREWNDETQEKYRADYVERLLPALGDRAVNSYTEEEIRDCLKALARNKDYSEGTMVHYNHLIYVLFEAAEQLGVCDNVLWGSELGLSEDEDEIEQRVRLKKSFTIEEQMEIYCALSKPPELISGQEIGLLLMNGTGIRNNEACGANYGSVQALDEHPDIYSLKIYQTTKINSAELKAGGKTRNANRLLPLMPITSNRIMQQRAYLEKLVSAGELILPEGTCVDDLPIVCYGRDYLRRCKSEDLTRAGKKLFREIGIGERNLQRLDAFVHSDEFQEMDFFEEELKEKVATTYLFRRNFVTYMELLDFTPAELEYYIGHMVEDDFKVRNSFVNEDKQVEMAEKLDRHPINWLAMEKEFLWKNPEHLKCEAKGSVYIEGPSGSQVGVRLVAKEPADEVRIELEGALCATARTMTTHSDYERCVDIRKQLLEGYRLKQEDIVNKELAPYKYSF